MVKKEFNIEELSGSGDLPAELEALREEVFDIRRRLEALQKRPENNSDSVKKIANTLARVAVIEKHLGIEIKQPEDVDA